MAQLPGCFTEHCPDLSAILQLFKENGMKMYGRKGISYCLFIRSEPIFHDNITKSLSEGSARSTVECTHASDKELGILQE